jgi:hypothetical protein
VNDLGTPDLQKRLIRGRGTVSCHTQAEASIGADRVSYTLHDSVVFQSDANGLSESRAASGEFLDHPGRSFVKETIHSRFEPEK